MDVKSAIVPDGKLVGTVAVVTEVVVPAGMGQGMSVSFKSSHRSVVESFTLMPDSVVTSCNLPAVICNGCNAVSLLFPAVRHRASGGSQYSATTARRKQTARGHVPPWTW